MAPPAAGKVDDDGEKPSLFRWLCTARKVDDDGALSFTWPWLYTVRKVVACAVVLLIIAVSVYAVVMVVRTGDLAVSVVGGSVLLTESNRLYFEIEFISGGRGIVYYTGVNAVLVAPANNTIMNLPLGDITVNTYSDHHIERSADLDKNSTTTTPYAKRFFSNHSNIIYGAELTLQGNLTTYLYDLHNRTRSLTAYNCHNITVGDNSDVGFIECEKSAAAVAAAAKLSFGVFLVIITLITSG